MDIIKAKIDVVFKMLFTKDNDILRAFVADILDIPKENIQNIIVENPNLLPYVYGGKQSQLDLKLSVDTQKVNVEIQLFNKGHFPERSLYYWSKLYADELKSGEDYSKLKRTICINILDFDLFTKCESPYSKFMLLEEKRHDLLTDSSWDDLIMSIQTKELDASEKESLEWLCRRWICGGW